MGKVIDINSKDDTPPEIPGKCNAIRKGKRCRNPAGMGTSHPGYGTCKHHLGCAPANTLSAHKEEAIEYTRSLAGELDINPVEALLWAVRLGAGAVKYWQELLSREDLPIEVALAVEMAYGAERDRMTKTAAVCIQAGLAEKRIRLAEKQGDMLAVILETVLERQGLSATKVEAAKKDAAQLMLALPGVAS